MIDETNYLNYFDDISWLKIVQSYNITIGIRLMGLGLIVAQPLYLNFLYVFCRKYVHLCLDPKGTFCVKL